MEKGVCCRAGMDTTLFSMEMDTRMDEFTRFDFSFRSLDSPSRFDCVQALLSSPLPTSMFFFPAGMDRDVLSYLDGRSMRHVNGSC